MLGETKPCVWGRKVCKTKKGSILHTRGSYNLILWKDRKLEIRNSTWGSYNIVLG
jgi:hypothetical protein